MRVCSTRLGFRWFQALHASRGCVSQQLRAHRHSPLMEAPRRIMNIDYLPWRSEHTFQISYRFLTVVQVKIFIGF